MADSQKLSFSTLMKVPFGLESVGTRTPLSKREELCFVFVLVWIMPRGVSRLSYPSVCSITESLNEFNVLLDICKHVYKH